LRYKDRCEKTAYFYKLPEAFIFKDAQNFSFFYFSEIRAIIKAKNDRINFTAPKTLKEVFPDERFCFHPAPAENAQAQNGPDAPAGLAALDSVASMPRVLYRFLLLPDVRRPDRLPGL
jgi:hypothetical protein